MYFTVAELDLLVLMAQHRHAQQRLASVRLHGGDVHEAERDVVHAMRRLHSGQGMVDQAAIEDAEKHGAKCDICKGQLSYKQHEQALLVEVPKGTVLKGNEQLREWLLSIKAEAEANSYAGFAFKEAEPM